MYKITTLAIFLLLTIVQPGASSTLTPKEELGKLLFFDTNLSKEKNQSCATCHQPPGFADPLNAAYSDESDRSN
jgi:cytochrome c peroxidase